MEKILKLVPPCFIHSLTGYYCPGCGGTRSLLLLLTGHPLRSLFYYPALPVAAGLLVWFLVSVTAERVLNRRVALHFPRTMKWFYLLLALVLANFVWKNAVLYWTGTPLIP